MTAASSLLEFTLAKHEFSMPVGGISYRYLEPLSFEEFLDALGQNEHAYCWARNEPRAICVSPQSPSLSHEEIRESNLSNMGAAATKKKCAFSKIEFMFLDS